MNKIDWKGKLSSRKFWALVAILVTSILVLFGVNSEVQVQITALITALGGVAIYIFGESKVDAAKALGYAQGKAIAEELSLDHVPSEEEIQAAYNGSDDGQQENPNKGE